MNGLEEAIDAVENTRKRLEIDADDSERATALERQFATRNVDVDRRSVATPDEPGFVILRSADGIVTTETIHTQIAQQSCDLVCNDFQWLL